MVKLADALAFGGRLTEALGVYRQASEMERLQGPEHLEKLLEYLTESVRRKEVGRCRRRSSGSSRGGAEADTEVPPAAGHHQRLGRPAAAGAASLSDPRKDYGGGGGSSADSCADFSCRICLSFLYEPVTLTCGHCFCKKCLEREKPGAAGCRECGSGSTALTDVAGGHGGYRVNVVLSNLLSKWFPLHSHAVRLRQEGNGLYADGKMEAALEKYNQAILIAPTDHILFSNRSQIHSSLRHYDQALRDAETTCTLMPQWSKGHVRKAQALMSLGRSEEALREYLISLSIEPSRLARSEAYKLLSDLLAPLTDHVPERVLDYSSSLSSRMHIKNNMAAHTASSHYTTASLKSSQSLSTSKSSSESNLLASPPVLKHPQCPCERSAGEEVRDQSEAQGGWLEQGFLPIRKRKSVEEEDGGEKRDGCKRSKLESAEVCSLSSVVADLIDPTDLECSLCMRLFYEPVTTPCGHTFCLQCLERCLDHNPKCPLCKQELSEYLAQRQYFKTVLMENLIAKYVPSEMMDRQKVNREELAELSNLNKNVPIFVCTMAFPTVPCPLHIFEPCYRLMIRRCMETGTKCFGMCLGDDLKGKISPRFASYGCLLEIRDVEFFSDGRSVVDTIGRRRFKVLQHHQRDGYNTADIEYLEDIKVEGVAEKELQSLHDAVYDQALIWVNSLKKEQKERIVGHFGPMPEKDPEPQTSPNGPSWCWWLLAVLPLEGRAQLPFLAITSLKERLCGIRRVLLFMTCSKHR